MTAISKFIDTYIKSHSMNFTTFGELVGVSHTTVRRWTKAESQPDLDQLVKISEATRVELCYLVELIYPQPARSVDPDTLRLAESIGQLPVEMKEMVDSIILGLSLKRHE